MKRYLQWAELKALTNQETADWFSGSDEGIYETEFGYACYICENQLVNVFKNPNDIIDYVKNLKKEMGIEEE